MVDASNVDNTTLSDPVIIGTIARLREEVPDLDAAAVEAHITLFRAYNVYFDALSTRYDELGLSHARFNMLRWLYHAEDNRLSMTVLGAYLEASVPNVIRMVEGLQNDGWVRRVSSQVDRRVTFVQLTEGGVARFRAMVPKAVRMWEDMQQGLSSEEQATLTHLLMKLRHSVLNRYIDSGDLVSHRIKQQRRKRAPKPDARG